MLEGCLERSGRDGWDALPASRDLRARGSGWQLSLPGEAELRSVQTERSSAPTFGRQPAFQEAGFFCSHLKVAGGSPHEEEDRDASFR